MFKSLVLMTLLVHQLKEKKINPYIDINIRVFPNSKHNKIERRNDEIVVRVTAPAIEGKANAAVCSLLAKKLGIAKSKVEIIKGHHTRNKLVRVYDQENDKQTIVAALLSQLFWK